MHGPIHIKNWVLLPGKALTIAMEVTGRDPQPQCLQKYANKDLRSLEKCAFTVRQNLMIINMW